MSRINLNFTITKIGTQIKLKFASTYNTVIWPSNQVVITEKFGNIFSIGIPSNMITLDYTKSTTNPESLSAYLLELHEIINSSGTLRIFGNNNAVGTTAEDIWIVGGDYNFLSSPSVLEILSENIQDDGITGLGAQSVRIHGLDPNYDEIDELVVLVGNSVSLPTTNQFIRVNCAVVESVGTVRGSNYNNLTIRVPTENTIVARIAGGYGTIDTSNYGIGITQLGLYTVPRNHTAYIAKVEINVESNKTGDISLYVLKDASVNNNSRQLVWKLSDFVGHVSSSFQTYHEVPEKSDIWLRGIASAESNIDTIMELIVIDNN